MQKRNYRRNIMNINNMNCEEIKKAVRKNGLAPTLESRYFKCLSDEELVSLYVKDDLEGAFNEIVDRHSDKIFRTALRITGNYSSAEEILQNVFMILVQSLSSFRNDSKFTTWLYRVVVNTSYMHLRSKKKTTENELLLEDYAPYDESGNLKDVLLKDWSDIPEDQLLGKEGNSILEKAISDLPVKYRKVFQLKDVEGFSNQEVADILDLSLPAVKSRALRARLYLRDKLSDYFYEKD